MPLVFSSGIKTHAEVSMKPDAGILSITEVATSKRQRRIHTDLKRRLANTVFALGWGVCLVR